MKSGALIQSQAFHGTTNPAFTKVSSWFLSSRKRVFDVLCSAPLLIAALPVMAITAIAVKLTSPGPALFRQVRTGKNGAGFEIIKFRTMAYLDNDAGPRLTQREDRRITALGRVIRRCKLDELPQLWNVICGDMSLVGPRPDLPEYLANLTAEQMPMLQLRPGITSPASLRFRREEDLLTGLSREELVSYYVNVILREKIRLELEYAEHATFFSDLKVLFRTALTAGCGDKQQA
jgi:lipopolysaccharide/colanic/teichoic acid biosynthesis glycosyltransferase